MKRPGAPFTRLSADGTMAAVDFGGWEGLLTLSSETFTPLPLPHGGRTSALSPDGALCAIAGFDEVALANTRSPQAYFATAPSPAPVKRVAVGNDGTVVATTAEDEDMAAFHVWWGDTLSPDADEVLGRLTVNELQFDERRGLAAIWGSTGPGVGASSGVDVVYLLDFSERRLRRRYEGSADLPLTGLNGILYPLQEGLLGLYDRARLLLCTIPAAPGEPLQHHTVLPFAQLGTTAKSPNGTLVAWLWNTWDGTRDHYHLSVGSIPDGAVLHSYSVEEVGRAPSLAVDDMGHVTLVYGSRPDVVAVRRFVAGALAHRSDMHLEQADGVELPF